MMIFLEYMFLSTIRMGTPIALTATGACLSERTGITNIGLEGIMSMGAFMAVVGTHLSGNPWIGVLCAVIVGIAMASIHGFVTITCGGAMGISSQSLILLSTGLASVGLQIVFNHIGNSDPVNTIKTTEILRPIPVIGKYLADLSPIVYIAVVVLFLANYLLNKTPLGLRMKACGEYPRATDTAGVNVNLHKYIGVLISGALGGLGGAFLSIGSMNLFQEGMIAGRGFLAIGAVIMGKWNPTGAFLAAMCFGFFDALQLYLQIMPNSPMPSQFIQMIPYVASLVVLTITIKGETGPAAVGQSFSSIAGTK